MLLSSAWYRVRATVSPPRHVVLGKTPVIQKFLLNQNVKNCLRRRSELGFEFLVKFRDRVVTHAQEFQGMSVDFIHGVLYHTTACEKSLS
jgi:hypothetical protein